MDLLFHDRVTGTFRSKIEGDALLGRWQLRLEPQKKSISLNSVEVQEGHFLIPNLAGQWLLTDMQDSGETLSGSFLQGQIPKELEVGSINSIGQRLGKLIGKELNWDGLLSVSPLVPGISERVALRPFEQYLKKHLCYLEEVCTRPRSNLHVEIERVPVSRARRIPSNAGNYLAAHTEDWERPTLTSVLPKRILTHVRYEQIDIYENRVCARLVDHLLSYLDKRTSELKRLRKLFQEAGSYAVDASGGSTWGRIHRICKLWGEAFDANEDLLKVEAEETLKKLELLKHRVSALMDSALYRQIPRRASVGASIRMTNILANDEHYRHVSRLWIEWARLGSDKQPTSAEIFARYQDLCRSFSMFCLLLAVRALDQLGYGPINHDRALTSRASIPLAGPEGKCTLTWDEDGTFLLEEEEDQVMRVVPLVATLASLNEDALKSFLVGLDTESGDIEKTLILYPSPSEATVASPDTSPLFQRLLSLRHDLSIHQRAPLGFLPVSPWDLGSVERMARAIRWTSLGHRYRSFPPRYHKIDSSLLALFSVARWATAGQSGSIALTCPPSEADLRRLGLGTFISGLGAEIKVRERELERANRDHNRVRASIVRDEIARLRRREKEAREIDVWLTRSAKNMQSLRSCPVCHEEASQKDFSGTEDGFFECMCSGCAARWGTRKCGSCRRYYPIIIPGNISISDSDKSVGWVDRVLGRDVLSAPCQERTSDISFICPTCHTCT